MSLMTRERIFDLTIFFGTIATALLVGGSESLVTVFVIAGAISFVAYLLILFILSHLFSGGLILRLVAFILGYCWYMSIVYEMFTTGLNFF